ncbi:DUF4238 domain-containing protein [Mesorhizobium sp. M0220]|uniref:DUF4238 domain-containing protein n=1 Tax=Mesorhizobium sp. M0220 TaxID=2956920 RepID=UPI00333BDD93
MKSTPKRHHWWPTCHSELWVDGEGCITMTNAAGEIRRTQPVNTAVIGHYNSIWRADGTRDSTLETFFANEVEGPAGPVLGRLATQKRRDYQLEQKYDKSFLRAEGKNIKRDGFVPDERAFSAVLSPGDRWTLSRYIASLMVRIPSYKDALNSNHMVQNIAAVLGLKSDEARFETDALHVGIIREHLEDYAGRIHKCALILIDAPDEEEFVIGDTPVIPAALGFGEAEAVCPISPRRALLVINGFRAPFSDRIAVFRCLRRTVRGFNRAMVQNAEREIFSRSPVSALFVTKNLGTRRARLVPTVTTAARGDRSGRGPMLDRRAVRRTATDVDAI